MKTLLDRIAAFVSWHRRAIGALLAVSSVLVAVNAASKAPPSVEVLSLAAPVAAGETITAKDLTRVALPAAAKIPTLSEAEVVGQVAATSLEAGSLLQPGSVANLPDTDPSRAVVPIALEDRALRALLRPGDPVTLVMISDEAAEVLTNAARIATLPRTAQGQGPLAQATTQEDSLVLVEVPNQLAPAVAALGQSGQLSIVLGAI